jgi:hypothetical protein
MVERRNLNPFNLFESASGMHCRSLILFWRHMNVLNILFALIAFFILLWAIWFVIGFIRYIRSGDYDVDKRLQDVSH